MGRNKIKIEKIKNERLRQVTFYKRKKGLLKKAMEISLLCNVKIVMCIVDKNKRNLLYISDEKNLDNFIQKNVKENFQDGKFITNKNYDDVFVSKIKRFSDYSELRQSTNDFLDVNQKIDFKLQKDIVNDKSQFNNKSVKKNIRMRIKLQKKISKKKIKNSTLKKSEDHTSKLITSKIENTINKSKSYESINITDLNYSKPYVETPCFYNFLNTPSDFFKHNKFPSNNLFNYFNNDYETLLNLKRNRSEINPIINNYQNNFNICNVLPLFFHGNINSYK